MPEKHLSTRHARHGKSGSPEYQSWRGMVQRCTNPNNASFRNYGAKGITCDARWMIFANFYADMGPKPTSKYWLERTDNSKGYFKDNCVWATPQVQMHNFARNRWITWQGRTQILSDWSRELSGSRNRLSARLTQGWTVERAMATPFR